jgi:hypothetical protein
MMNKQVKIDLTFDPTPKLTTCLFGGGEVPSIGPRSEVKVIHRQ